MRAKWKDVGQVAQKRWFKIVHFDDFVSDADEIGAKELTKNKFGSIIYPYRYSLGAFWVDVEQAGVYKSKRARKSKTKRRTLMSKRIFSFLLAALMVLSTIPAVALVSGAEAESALVTVSLNAPVKAGNGWHDDAAKVTNGNTDHFFDLGYWGTGGKIDGANGKVEDPSTVYPLAESKCYVEIDLGASYNVKQFDVWTITGRDYRFVLYGTNDNTADITTWTKLGGKESEGTMTSAGHTTTLETAVNCRYVRAYGIYNNENIGFHFNEISIKAEVNKLNIRPRFSQIENWANSTSMGEKMEVTQILVGIDDSEMIFDSGVTWNGQTLEEELKKGTYKTQLVIETGSYGGKTGMIGKVLDIDYSTRYDTMLRFEPCIVDDPFVPVKGVTYQIRLNLFNKDGSLYATGVNSWTCPVSTRFIYDEGTTFTDYPSTKQIGWYGSKSEMCGGTDLVFLPNNVSTAFVSGMYDSEMVIGSAVYPLETLENNYSWAYENYMARVRILKEGFTPAPGVSYDVVFNSYTTSVPSGDKVLIMTHTAPGFVNATAMDANVPYIYDIGAENGKVLVDFNNETGEYTLTANMPAEGYGFDHWEVDGKAIEHTDTAYTFKAVDGAKSTVKAVYKKWVKVNWVVNGETVVDYVAPGKTPVPPVGATDGYETYAVTYTFTGWDKEIVAATEEATYTAQYTESARAPRVPTLSIGYGDEGIENSSSGARALIRLESDPENCDLAELLKNKSNYRFVLRFNWTEDGVAKEATVESQPTSSIWGGDSASWFAQRFPLFGAHEGFALVKDQKYVLNMDVYDLTVEGYGEEGYHYISTNSTVEFCISDEPVTFEYYTVTWTKGGETVATETWREGLTPVAPVPATYTEGTKIYTLNTPVVEVSENVTYEIVYDMVDTAALTLGKWGTGWDNWLNSPNNPTPGQQPGITQLLLRIYDYQGNGFEKLFDDKANYTWELTINGKTYIHTPETLGIGYAIYRFELCTDEQFVPVYGESYEVGLRLLNADGSVAYYSANTVTTTVPVVPVHDHVEGESAFKDSTVYEEGYKGYVCETCKGLVVTETIAKKEAIGGDIDGDGQVMIGDVTALLNFLAMSAEEQAAVIEGRLLHVEALNVDGSADAETNASTMTIGDVTVLLSVLSDAEGYEAVLGEFVQAPVEDSESAVEVG